MFDHKKNETLTSLQSADVTAESTKQYSNLSPTYIVSTSLVNLYSHISDSDKLASTKILKDRMFCFSTAQKKSGIFSLL